jgi:hypothetical protein
MSTLLHRMDLQYAALPDAQVEAMWRHAVAYDAEAREPLLRQLVLRAAVVLEETCRREGGLLGYTESEHERAYSESAQRLLSRLRIDPDVRDIRALAHEIACEVVADPERRRAPRIARFATPAPARLRLISVEDSR